jgi:hypothetical protein
VRELDLRAQVEALDGGRVADVCGECSTVPVVALQGRVLEGNDLGDEGVGPHELVQGVLEVQAILFNQGVEPFQGGIEGRVDLAVLLGAADGEQERHRGLDLLRP